MSKPGTSTSLPRQLTIQQVAEHTQFSTRQVRRWLKAGKLKGSQFGRHWRVAESDLALFLVSTQSGLGVPCGPGQS